MEDDKMIEEEKMIQNDDEITITLDDEAQEQVQNAALEKEKKLNDELKGDLRRLKAEFENYRRRTDILSKNAVSAGNCEVIEKLLPLMDAFENAENLIKDKQILEGVTLIHKQLEDVFDQYSVKKIEALGAEFDPLLHNAILTKEDAQNSGKVIEVVKTGYTIGEKVLRYAYVVVGE